MIKVLFFASLRDQLNTDQVLVDYQQLAAGGETNTTGLQAYLCRENPQWHQIFRSQMILSAVNQEISHRETALQDGDEVAFFPPVTGG